MALILSLETSARFCSVALHDNTTLVSQAEIRQEHSHASKLAILIQDVLKSCASEMKQIDAVAISAGPGSYTGLRIGTSTAKGICYALDIPLISVNTLDLLASQASQQIKNTNALLCPMIDARRMEVYCQVVDSGLRIINPVEAKVIDESSFGELLKANIMFFFGDGAEKCMGAIAHNNAFFLADIFPQAAALGVMAEKKFRAQQFEDLIGFKPLYVKDFVAKKAQSVF